MDGSVEEIPIQGFDPASSPTLYRMADGTAWLMFESMPPSWVPKEDHMTLGPCRDLADELERTIGTEVIWEDREAFLIPDARQVDAGAIAAFLTEFRRRHEGRGSDPSAA